CILEVEVRRFSLAFISFVAVSLALASLARGQVSDNVPRPHRLKIGVALEGGGALGLAHIGVLEWFEAHRIPVDYLAGTSMGGLVGGLYATGMRANELRDLVSRIDWDEMLGEQTSYRALSFRRKE